MSRRKRKKSLMVIYNKEWIEKYGKKKAEKKDGN